MNFKDITVVNVDGRYGDLHGAQLSLIHTTDQLPGARAILLSPERPANLMPGITHFKIKPMGYLEYSLFIIYALHHFIKTDFALIVQDDGWLVNIDHWDDQFLNYDYVGAPTHSAKVTRNGATGYLSHYEYTPYLALPDASVEVVMCGGFSLRSKRMLLNASTHKIPLVLPSPSLNTQDTFGLAYVEDTEKEDVQLLIHMDKSKGNAMTYPPLELSRRFAIEHYSPILHSSLDFKTVFGHHSKLRKLTSINPLTIEYQVSLDVAKGIIGEPLIIDFFERAGYKVDFSAREIRAQI